MTEQDYKTFFDDAPLALLRTDLETGKFLMANKFAATLLGCYSVEELLTKDSSNFYSTTVRNKLIKKLKKSGTVKDQEIEMNVNGNTFGLEPISESIAAGLVLSAFWKTSRNSLR